MVAWVSTAVDYQFRLAGINRHVTSTGKARFNWLHSKGCCTEVLQCMHKNRPVAVFGAVVVDHH